MTKPNSDAFKGDVGSSLSEFEILSSFEKIRQEQRHLYADLAKSEMHLAEYREVIKMLKDMNPDLPCFRLSDEVLVGQTIQEAYPFVLSEKEKLEEKILDLNKKIKEKSKQIYDYQTIYNIRVNPDKYHEKNPFFSS